jgi:hypothetical protein
LACSLITTTSNACMRAWAAWVPLAAPSELPMAICPQGVPESYGTLPTELPPGVSALDGYLAEPHAPQEGVES